MLVRHRMTSPAVTVRPETDRTTALRTMYARRIRRLPVVDEQGRLVGIVTQRELLEKGSASTPVGEIMTRNPYTTSPDVPLVRAAALMRTVGIGALPVLEQGQVVGIITESDIFDAFLELLGARHPGARVIVPIPDVAEGVTRALAAVRPTGVRLVGLTTYRHDSQYSLVLASDEDDPRDLIRALSDAGLVPTHVGVGDAADRRPG